MTTTNMDFTRYAIKQVLVSANAFKQVGTQWTLTLETPALGIDTSRTFPSQDAAADAVYQTLYTQYQKSAA